MRFDNLFNKPYSISASLQEKVSENNNFHYRLLIFVKRYQTCFYFQVQEWSYIYRCKGIHVLAYFEPCHPTRKFDINDDNLIYGHHQDYYRKSYFIRNAELWNLLLSSLKTMHYFSSVKASLNNIYLSKRETHNPPGCYRYMFFLYVFSTMAG